MIPGDRASAAIRSVKDMDDETQDMVHVIGELERMGMEGSFWLLHSASDKYDLHGDRELARQFKTGDKVRVSGSIPRGRTCFHMSGTIIDVENIEFSPGIETRYEPFPGPC